MKQHANVTPKYRVGARRHGVSRVLEQHGSWAVTTYGVEHLALSATGTPLVRYLDRSQIHIIGITAIVFTDPLVYDPIDFCCALQAARDRWPKPPPKKIGPGSRPRESRSPAETQRRVGPRRRFEILQRDGFRCQICGRSAAADDVRLEVDHKHPVSRGGTDAGDNLWTLCFDCNSGKSDQLLAGAGR